MKTFIYLIFFIIELSIDVDCSEDEVLKRISMQMRQSEKEKLSDFVIHNNNDSKLLSQVLLIKQAIDQS